MPELPSPKAPRKSNCLTNRETSADSEPVASETTPIPAESHPAKERNPRAKALILPKFNKRSKLLCMDSAVQKLGISLPPKPAASKPLVEPRPSPDSSDGLEELTLMNSKAKLGSKIQKPKKANNFKKPDLPPKASQESKDLKRRTSLAAIGSPTPTSRAKPSLRKSNSNSMPYSSSPALPSISPPSQARRTVPAATSKKSMLKKSMSFDPVVHTLSEVHAQGVDMGPWSAEAGDLFDWKPSDWESRRGRIASTVEGVD
jgi:hypothetical protein